MEKHRAHHSLADIKALIEGGNVSATRTALDGAARLGFAFEDMVDLIMQLETADFHKSMTTHADHKIWQAVYRFPSSAGDVYLKLTVATNVIIVSFKEL